MKFHALTRPWRRLLLLALLSAATVASAAGLPPDQLVKATADEVLAVIRTDPTIAAGDMRELLALVEDKVLGHFDFARMTRLAVGKNWRMASPAQQDALTAAFRTLLVRTYAVALAQFHDRTIVYAPLDQPAGGTEATVHTTIKPVSGQPIHMDYRMFASDGDWKVYDILVEGVSLVINYRSLFDSTVEQSGIAGLVTLLEQKNAATAHEQR